MVFLPARHGKNLNFLKAKTAQFWTVLALFFTPNRMAPGLFPAHKYLWAKKRKKRVKGV